MSKAETAAPVKGTVPEGTHTETEASRRVREMFTQIAPKYDLLNHVLSLQLDRLWRARVARILKPMLQRGDAMVLDLCCGTGDLALALKGAGPARVIGADFAHPMLVQANAKSGAKITFLEADALRLPFADCSFDLLTAAFGFRNLANYESGLREIMRVLKPGGTAAILEFTEPPAGILGNMYRWYFRGILPRIGGLLSGDRNAYTYLPRSVSRFFRPAQLADLMASVGYGAVKYRVWTMGTVALHTGTRSGG
ncbi:MAG: bifunctional demethylmenaquinone methyltransferase/2-methoxy-6-polyprenyl-1,4-benzoquinol methylase UbiE [Acidobacteriota bacterium]|nr:bifunctional demethylmenaquinone methyltransferase/2-methoxy-6-polyprenyl-1,4-benzoquinol methylase UbiE [Acidobacteriota bacterium]